MQMIFGAVQRFFRRTDKLLMGVVIGVSVLSVLLLMGVNAAGYCNSRVVQTQIIAAALGVAGACVVANLDYDMLARLWKLYAPLVVLMNIYTAFFGDVREGTGNRSWLNVGITSVQPSEFLKLALILTFSYHLSLTRDSINSPKTLFPLLVHGFGGAAIILLQGDTGVAIILAGMVLIMLFMAGLSKKIIGAGVAAVVALVPIVWNLLLSQYHRDRILALFYPDQYVLNEAHQQLEGLLSIGSGQIFGIGIFAEGHNYVPEMYNDFIFTFLGESLGFVGCFSLLVAYVVICVRILMTAVRCKDDLGKYICIGVLSMLIMQIAINIGMCLMIMPVIGVTLPLLSAGGSSVVTVYAGMGLVLSVYASNNKNMFVT